MSFEPMAFYSPELNKVFASITSSLLTFKIFDWLRLFEKTAFIIILVKQTVVDIGQFMMIIFFAWLMFGFPMVILDQNRNIDDEDSLLVSNITGIWLIDMLINQYLLSLGEFTNLDAFVKGPQTAMCYAFFALTTFIV